MIGFFNHKAAYRFKGKQLARAGITALISEENKRTGDISFIFCSDEYLLDINKTYLRHDYYTDVITFDYCTQKTPKSKIKVSGDIFISIKTVRANAQKFGVTFEQELTRVMYHGVLHLCGYKDKSPKDKKVMKEKENYYLDKLSIKKNNERNRFGISAKGVE
ncbi:MAG: rRNA maturation RNase YbeY [Prevotellaceae bacterium]|jgi:rRNA maturation RNase YbeY|nr:rRNA maturation RNase YbeY [Prevotellaceae bacterium]